MLNSHLKWIADPVFLSVGSVTIRWYAVFFVIGMILSYRFVENAFEKQRAQVDRLFLYVFFGGIVGARLGHTLFYEPSVYLAHPLEILKIWQGGLASHGAVLAVILAVLFYSRKYKIGFLWMADRVSTGFVLLGGFIRLGNLFNSEIIGRPTEVPWALIFSRVDQNPRHPTQIYEAAYYFLLFFIMRHLFYKTSIRQREGALFGIFLAGVFSFRFLIEFLKENQVTFESGMPLNLGQLLSIPLVLGGVWLLLRKDKVEEVKLPPPPRENSLPPKK